MPKRNPPPAKTTPPIVSINAAKSQSFAGTALVFAPAIFGGALLLFAVQPLIARYLLPWFGGGPGVWTTCMLFFQALLLGGYLYAHLSVRYLPTRGQIALHVVLLISSLATLPIIPSDRWKPVDAASPVGRLLLLLAVTIGLPYFVLSATSPLLQAWFVRVRPGASPYRLFALSNLGSLLALILYPAILEPLLTRRQQAWLWSGGLIAFVMVCVACAAHVWRRASSSRTNPEIKISDVPDVERHLAGVHSTPSDHAPIHPDQSASPDHGPLRTVLWLALPMVASVLLLATTNVLTEDVAVTPLLWIVPLALYLVTFIIAFDGPRWYPRRAVLILLALATLWVFRLQALKPAVPLLEQFAGYLTAMFLVCLYCHGELARLRPDPAHLTRYYLAISIGGALGGVCVAIVAPRVFNQLFELPLGIFATAGLSLLCLRISPMVDGKRWALLFIGAAIALVAGVPLLRTLAIPGREVVIDRSRNFYGTLAVADFHGEKPEEDLRAMNHGNISHGSQYLDPARRRETTLYYREGSGASFAFHYFPRQSGRNVGLIGLGAGTLAAYGQPGDHFRFYEINPDVDRLARKDFTFIADSAADCQTILGDARLTLEREPDQNFDILVLDAFSGDSIPTHLLTAEAFDVYARHLKPDGIIAAHISNRSVDLIQVLLRQAERLGRPYVIINDRDEATGKLQSRWMLITRNPSFLENPAVRSVSRLVQANETIGLWTDDHVNLLQVIHWLPQ